MIFPHGRRLVFAFVLVLLFGVGLCIVNFSNSQRVLTMTDRLVGADLPVLRRIHELKIAIVRQEPILYEYYAAMDGKRFALQYEENEQIIKHGLELLNRTFPGGQELEGIRARHDSMRRLAADLQLTMSAREGVDWDRAREILADNTREASAINASVDVLLQQLREQVQQRGQSTRDAMDSITRSVLAFACALLLFTALAGYSIRAYLREAGERYRLSLFPLRNPNPIMSIDAQGKVLFANPGAEQTLQRLGLDPGEPARLLPADIADQIAALRQDGSSDTRVFDYPLGQAIYHCKLSHVTDIGLIYVYLADVTASRRAEEAMRIAKESAEASSLAKSQFLANMSHEIRTPMNGVIGMTELLLESPLSAQQRALVQGIERSGTHLLCIINDVLDFSKIEAGKFSLELAPINPRLVVEDSVHLVEESARAKALPLHSAIDAALPGSLMGDALRLHQVLVNLLGNAIKFTSEGSVTLRLDVLERGPKNVRVRFSVRDTGIGIAPEVRGQVFEAFRQADGGTTRKYGGTGLGLAIARELVRLMGGELELDSEPGRGSCFWFDLSLQLAPVAISDARGAPQAADAHSRIGTIPAGHLILLVEDNPVNQLLAKQMLTLLGHDHHVANNGREALAMAGATEYDLILMDCQMPELDGFETTRQLRKQQGTGPRVPIIALTANALQGDKDRCLEAGMDDYLSKPFKKQQLADKIDRWLAPAQSPH